jgi:hypothetical protein
MIMLAGTAANAQESVCQGLLSGGVFEQYRSQSNEDYVRDTYHYICEHDFKSIQEAQSGGVNATIPIEEVLVGVGIKYDASKFDQAKHDFCNIQFDKLVRNTSVVKASQQVSTALLSAFNDCVAADHGFTAWVVGDEPYSIFSIKYQYKSSGAPYETAVKGFDSLDASLRCVPVIAKGDKIGSAQQVMSCSRTDTKAETQIVFNTENGSALFRLRPYHDKPIAYETECDGHMSLQQSASMVTTSFPCENMQPGRAYEVTFENVKWDTSAAAPDPIIGMYFVANEENGEHRQHFDNSSNRNMTLPTNVKLQSNVNDKGEARVSLMWGGCKQPFTNDVMPCTIEADVKIVAN